MSRVLSVERGVAVATVIFRLSDGLSFRAHFNEMAEAHEVADAFRELLDENARLKEQARDVRLAVEALVVAARAMRQPLPYNPDEAQWSEPGDEKLRAVHYAAVKSRDEALDAALAPYAEVE